MRKFRRINVFLISLILIVSLNMASDSEQETDKKKKIKIMLLKDIKPGMKGFGISIFGGIEPQKPERFKFVINQGQPTIDFGIKNKKLILAILSGGPNNIINEAGVIAGISGSPAYIKGKLIGAVSCCFNIFQTRPLAGITPI